MHQVYRTAVAAGIPCHVPMTDFFGSAEVCTAVALLRCVVDPSNAGEAVKKRLGKSGTLKVPLATGLGRWGLGV